MGQGDSAKRKSVESMSSKPMSILWVLLLVLGTNVVTVFLFSGPLQYYYHTLQSTLYSNPHNVQSPLPSNDLLIAKLNQTQQELLKLGSELKSSKQVAKNLAAELVHTTQLLRDSNAINDENIGDPWLQWGGPNRVFMSKELQDFTSGKKLPFGQNPNFGSDTIYPPIGHACAIFKGDLNKYMDYKPGQRCPDDEILAQKLMLRGCEPLPRRRCYPKTPAKYSEPYPFPESMWKTPPDSSVVWTAYSCKNYSCLIQRKYQKGFDDCKDCFDLQGREKTRWVNGGGSMDYSVDEVLNLKKTIRIGQLVRTALVQSVNSQEFLKKVAKCGVVENILSWADFKQSKDLKKTDGTKRQRLTGITKLDDANDAGSQNSDKCTLILTEGDSAKALAMAGLAVVGRNHYGVFPLRGKLLNVREASHKQIMENAEIQHIKQILGLQHGKEYDSVKSLRYGHLMIMTDQDHDGSHIKGLLINFIHSFWPSLLKIPSFLVEFIAPIVKATHKDGRVLSFYTMPEYESWRESLGGSASGWTIKYYKGLGTSTSKEGKEYFKNLQKHKKDFMWINDDDGDAIELAFSKKKIEARKNWLRHF